MIRRIWFGIGGGMVAGTAVGAVEALFVLSAGSSGEYLALVVATALYALAGAACGLGVGLLIAALGATWRSMSDAVSFSIGIAGVSCPFGLAIARHAVDLAIFRERGLDPVWEAGLAAAFALLGALVLWLGPIFFTRTPLKVLPRPKGTFAACGAALGLAAIFSFAPGSGVTDGTLAPDRPASALPSGAPDIVLVVVDTLRVDHLGAYGSGRGLTPAIDALARESVVFEQHLVSASWTRPSFASLFSSMIPTSHRCRGKADALPDDVVTLAEVLSRRGYATGGLPNNVSVGRSFNFQQGFDWYAYQGPSAPLWSTESAARLLGVQAVRRAGERLGLGGRRVAGFYQPAEVVLGEARRFVEENRARGNRWFLVVHLMEPHDPYFAHPEDGRAVGRAWHPDPDPAEVGEIRALYEGEVRWVDARLGEFVEWMRSAGAWEQTLFVLTSDHGEEFREHGGWWHGTTLYDEQIRVPLLVRLPGGRYGGARAPWQVRQIDVAPTLAAAAGAEVPPDWQGADLFDAVATGALEREGAGLDRDEIARLERVAVAEQDFEGNALSAIRAHGWKYVRAAPGGPRALPEEEVFDFAGDPGETVNLAGRDGSRQAELSRVLRETLDAAARAVVKVDPVAISCEECLQFGALGYAADCEAACGERAEPAP